jgi:FKBP-type peptidyl-prolyl cis-trans isomerase 2/predicted Fe-Mo cluster-binding NifX family protein
MKIAVTYDNGNVFQHFGRTEQFKVYDVEDGKIVSSEIMGTNGIGHEALAGLLAQYSIDALICGGMGQGAQDALAEAGIDVCAGAEGDTDAAVEAYLRGELINTGVNCDHHHEGEHDHHHEESGCGGCGTQPGGCGGCPGCGEPQYYFESKNTGKTVKVHYKGTYNDGEQFDSSYDRGEPLEFVCAAGMMIPGFDLAVGNMEVGDIVDVHLMPEEAYGMPRPEMIITVEKSAVEGAGDLVEGDRVYLQDQLGRPFSALVTAVDDINVTFDCNHEMAGKELNFTIELLEVI